MGLNHLDFCHNGLAVNFLESPMFRMPEDLLHGYREASVLTRWSRKIARKAHGVRSPLVSVFQEVREQAIELRRLFEIRRVAGVFHNFDTRIRKVRDVRGQQRTGEQRILSAGYE